MTPTKLVTVALGLSALVVAYFLKEPTIALVLSGVGGNLIGLVFPELGKKP